MVTGGRTVGCATEHPVGSFDLALSKKVSGPTRVVVGDRIRYRLVVTNRGRDAAPGPIRVVDKLPRGLKLVSARGTGWSCKVTKATRKAVCVRTKPLAARAKAPAIVVTAKATRAALRHRIVNTAVVRANGDRNPANDRDRAVIRVGKVPPMPATGFRLTTIMPWW